MQHALSTDYAPALCSELLFNVKWDLDVVYGELRFYQKRGREAVIKI